MLCLQAAEGHPERELPHGDDRPHLPGGRAQGGEQEHPRLRRQGQEHPKQGGSLGTVTLFMLFMLGFPKTHFTMPIICCHTEHGKF